MIKYGNTIACDHTCWIMLMIWCKIQFICFALALGLCLVVGRILLVSRCIRPFRQQQQEQRQQQQQQQQLRGNSNSQYSLIEPWTIETNQHISVRLITRYQEISIVVFFNRAATIDRPSSISNLKFFVGRSRCKQSQRWPRQRGQYGNRLKWIEFANYKTASANVKELSTWPHILRTAWKTLLLKLGRQPMHTSRRRLKASTQKNIKNPFAITAIHLLC